MARRFVVMKDPVTINFLTQPVDKFSQFFEHLLIVDLINGLHPWNKFFVDDSTA